jgi:diphthine synthase
MSIGKLLFIGLGLYNEKDVSLNGLSKISSCDVVFAEFYTSTLIGLKENSFEKEFGKPITILNREQTEKGDIIIESAKNNTVGFLTGGDPMIATTHVDLRIRAIKQGITTEIIHSSSIATAASGLLGLQNYKFGRTTTLAYPEKNFFPTSPYSVIFDNKKMGLHTLVLLDIKQDQNRYMTASEGIKLLLEMEEIEKKNLFTEESLGCVVARAGSPNVTVAADSFRNLLQRDFGKPLHTLVIPGDLHFMEIEALQILADLPSQFASKLQKV